jgi:hypothetical protein
MQCVALGAAVQAALVTDLTCPACAAPNPVAEDNCLDCSGPLFGGEKVTCPVCFLLSDLGQAECWKCGGSLPTPAGVSGASAPRRQPAAQPATAAEPGPAAAADAGGLACRDCGTVNGPGTVRCGACGTELAESPYDITPKDLGIELIDGRMSVIIPKNTNYPTLEPVSRDFETATAGQRRLELCVYEGPQELAQRNELCGYLTVPLPEGIPARSLVSVSFGLDADRTITVSVQIHAASSTPKTARLQHFGRLDPEMQRKVETGRQAVTGLLDRWTKELTAEELAVLYRTADGLDQLAAGSDRRSVDAAVAEAEKLADTISTLRGEQAYVGAVRSAAGRYLSESQRRTLDAFHGAIQDARERGDLLAARAVADNAEAEIESYGDGVRTLVYCRTFLSQGDLSPALAGQVRAALRRLDDALERDQQDEVRDAMRTLLDLWEDVKRELDENDDRLPTITGVKERGKD